MDDIKDKFSNERQEPAPRVLYVVGTPIGNLGDLSPRAKSVLSKVSTIACEDTRRTGKFLKSLGLQQTLLSFHQHNTKSRIPKLIELLREGKSLAIVSDAGLPGISDPGEELINQAKKMGYGVICIPGPCAAITALISSGLPTKRFSFEGFLPFKSKERKKTLELIAKETKTTVIYESPYKLITLLRELASICGEDRPMTVARELTKYHEETIGHNIGAVLQHFLKHKPKGECTVVLGGAIEVNQKHTSLDLLKEMQVLISNGASYNEAAKTIAQKTGTSKRYLYSLLH
tara:strand:+ start:1066 stop:1932 length:867 start_codon:yes stop_codon:yes gene_type:complete